MFVLFVQYPHQSAPLNAELHIAVGASGRLDDTAQLIQRSHHLGVAARTSVFAHQRQLRPVGHATLGQRHHQTFHRANGRAHACHKAGGHGSVNLSQAISKSCNPAFIEIGQKIGISNFSKYFKAFGFAEKTGIDLPGEAASNYHKEENMGPVELSSSSFGQSFNITPIQMITAVSACVNGGYLVRPHLVEKTLDQDGKVYSTADIAYKRQVVSETTSAIMNRYFIIRIVQLLFF
jgi:cell division protein FtsI/penicillin-binding protein 2